ncbi:NAD(P)-binding domain-containing protein [Flavobacterium columnare]|uniref:NAD(P)-binding domain-containing protein n=1 Tax=Flavobacterium columnare TaxID=996 RepID=UPI00403325DE
MYKKRIGVIGVGTMGKELVNIFTENDLLNGYFDVSENLELDDKYLDYRSSSINCLLFQSSIIFLCLPNKSSIENVVDTLCKAKKTRKLIIVDMSTSSPSLASEIHEKCLNNGISYFESPMIGGVRSLKKKELKILINGDKEDYLNLFPILNIFCSKIYFFQKKGEPNSMKLIHNMVTISNSFIAMNALSICEEMKFDKETFFDIIENGTASSYVIKNTLKRTLLENDYNEGYKLGLVKKDMIEILNLIDEKGNHLDVFSNIFEKIISMVDKNNENYDYPIIYSKIKKHT